MGIQRDKGNRENHNKSQQQRGERPDLLCGHDLISFPKELLFFSTFRADAIEYGIFPIQREALFPFQPPGQQIGILLLHVRGLSAVQAA